MNRFSSALLGLILAGCLSTSAADSNNEKEWTQLFNGKDLSGWHSFKKTVPPAKGWVVEEGALKHAKKAGGGDLVSEGEYDNFDLRWEWKVASGANSGLKYFVLETRRSAIGHEYQLIDDDKHPDALRGPKWQTASFYDVLPPANKHVKPVGEWNESRVLVQGNHVEHWLNGQKVLSYELGSAEVKAAVAQSKFKSVEGFGERVKGHILLQDHGDEIAFRAIRIKEIH
jgi:hypothetical protein